MTAQSSAVPSSMLRNFARGACSFIQVSPVAIGSLLRPLARTTSLFKAARRLAVAFIVSFQRKRRQPGFAANDPVLVGRHQLVGGVQRSQMHFDLVVIAREDRRAATLTEVTTPVLSCLAFDGDCNFRENGRSEEQSAMMLAAVEAMAQADA